MSDNKLDVTVIQKPDQSYMVAITYIHLCCFETGTGRKGNFGTG